MSDLVKRYYVDIRVPSVLVEETFGVGVRLGITREVPTSDVLGEMANRLGDHGPRLAYWRTNFAGWRFVSPAGRERRAPARRCPGQRQFQ